MLLALANNFLYMSGEASMEFLALLWRSKKFGATLATSVWQHQSRPKHKKGLLNDWKLQLLLKRFKNSMPYWLNPDNCEKLEKVKDNNNFYNSITDPKLIKLFKQQAGRSF